MLQPGTYPELVGKALVLEPDPFLTFARDDEPAAEGALLVALTGFAVGAALVVGSALQQWLAPPVATAGDNPWLLQEAASPTLLGWLSDPMRETMRVTHLVVGGESNWWWLALLVILPAGLLLAWVAIGALLWAVGGMMGGTGSLTEVIGASALISAPMLLYLLHIIPFTHVNLLLPAVWATLLFYRAAQTSHDLTWSRALGVTLICLLVVAVTITMLAATTLLLSGLL
jgi:hypothetical protein